MTNDQSTLFELLLCGLGHTRQLDFHKIVSWPEVMFLSQLHGVDAIAFDGIQRCFDAGEPIGIDINTKVEWIGFAQQQEQSYAHHEALIGELARFYAKHGIRMMVLKGWGLSLNYPVPRHRTCSDLDIYLFGEQQKADRLLHEELDIKTDNSHHHHSVFNYKGLTVENHYDFLNIYAHLSSRKIEKRLKELAGNAVPFKMKDGTEVWLPTADFNALFILRHTAAHFAGSAMSIRQIIDWGLFVKKHHDEVNWNSLLPLIKELNMHHFYDAQNYICYHYLGFDKSLFPMIEGEEYGERVFQDFFNEENTKPKEKGYIKYIYSRFKKWWSNRWKHRIVYPEGLLTTFFVQVVSHLMKPATLHN